MKRFQVIRWKPSMGDDEEYVGGLMTRKEAIKLCNKLREEDTQREYYHPVTAHDGTDRGFWNISVYELLDESSGYAEEVY